MADVGNPVTGIIDWQQVIYGNARLGPDNKTITCQHGPAECDFNILQTCVVELSGAKGGGGAAAPNASLWLPAIHCLEGYGSNQGAHAKECVEGAGMAFAPVQTCWKGPEGAALELAAAARTAALNPPHEYVPWVTLSGQSGTFCTENGCDNMLDAVCKAYTGSPKPANCTAA